MDLQKLIHGSSSTNVCLCEGSDGKASACNAGDLGSIPGSGRSPGEGNGNPLQYSCLENPMDGGAWWATVHGTAESDMTERLHFPHVNGLDDSGIKQVRLTQDYPCLHLSLNMYRFALKVATVCMFTYNV